MSARRVLATWARVLRQLRADPRSVVLLLVAPSALLALFAWLFEGTGRFGRVGPVVLALFPFVVMFLVTSVTVLRERRSGMLERLLTTPLRRGELLAGYALAFGTAALVQAVVTVALAVGPLGLEVSGSPALLALVAVVDALLGTTTGLLASAFATTEFQAVQLMPVLVFPQVVLGGVFVPREAMGPVQQAISDVLPLSYAVQAAQAVATGASEGAVWRPLGVVAACILLAVALGATTLRRRTP